MVSRIDLEFEKTENGRSRFSSGVINLRPDPNLYKLVSRGDWISFERVVEEYSSCCLGNGATIRRASDALISVDLVQQWIDNRTRAGFLTTDHI